MLGKWLQGLLTTKRSAILEAIKVRSSTLAPLQIFGSVQDLLFQWNVSHTLGKQSVLKS